MLREWIAANAEAGEQVDQVGLARLYVTPKTGELVAMDSTARRLEEKLAQFLRLRDERYRTRAVAPWSATSTTPQARATVDRPTPPTARGSVSAGLRRTSPGWSARPRPGPRHTIETITPTGHRYISTAPALSVAERGLQIAIDDYVLMA